MTRPQWRRIGSIVFWLFLFPPWGLYLLWRDAELSRATKWRVVIYSFLLLVLIPVTMMLFTLSAGQKMIDAAGG